MSKNHQRNVIVGVTVIYIVITSIGVFIYKYLKNKKYIQIGESINIPKNPSFLEKIKSKKLKTDQEKSQDDEKKKIGDFHNDQFKINMLTSIGGYQESFVYSQESELLKNYYEIMRNNKKEQRKVFTINEVFQCDKVQKLL